MTVSTAPWTNAACMVCVSLSAWAFPATPTPAATTGSAEVIEMQRHIDELEARLKKLEKAIVVAGGDNRPVSGAPSDSAVKQRMKEIEARLEARFAEMEQSRAVRAPFRVVNSEGNALLTVDSGPTGKGAQLVVGDPKGQSVLLYARNGSAFVNLMEASGRESVALTSNEKGHGFYTHEEFGSTFVGSFSGEKVPVVQTKNKAGFASVELKTLPDSQSGAFTLTNASGLPIVMAGETSKGAGSVKTGPKTSGAASMLGNMGVAASEIQGRIK